MGTALPADVRYRTLAAGEWSAWLEFPVEDDGAGPREAEHAGQRPGSGLVWLEGAQALQVSLPESGAVAGLTLAVVADPAGTAASEPSGEFDTALGAIPVTTRADWGAAP